MRVKRGKTVTVRYWPPEFTLLTYGSGEVELTMVETRAHVDLTASQTARLIKLLQTALAKFPQQKPRRKKA